MTKRQIPSSLQPWIDARRRFNLSHAHVQMARELGMNPKKLGGKANHRQEPWKRPLTDFIEDLYEKRFGRRQPDDVVSIEERAQALARKKALRREKHDVQSAARTVGSALTPGDPRTSTTS